MRSLYINDVLIDLDDNTAIGIDLQTYDIKSPATRKVKISNQFTIPITNNNLAAVGRIGGAQNNENTIYSKSTCNYYINNIHYINNSRVKVIDIQDRITLYIYDKDDIWDTLKKVTWLEFVQSYYEWLSCPKEASSVFTGDFDGFINQYTKEGGTHGLFLPITAPNQASGSNNIYVSRDNIPGYESGGAFMSFVIDVFKYIEDTYSLNFYTTELFTGNIWFDEIGSSMYWNYRHIHPVLKGDGSFYFDIVDDTEPIKFVNNYESQETSDKTLYDFVLSFIQQLNIMVQPVDGGFKLSRFDDLINMPVIDFSGKITGVPKFKPSLEGYAQNNYIRFKDVETGISTDTNKRNITSLNENVDIKTDLFAIEAFIPTITDNDGALDQFVPNLSTEDSYKNFKYFVNNGQRVDNIDVRILIGAGNIDSNQSNMFYASIYSLSSEYTLLDSALDYPVYYEFKKWLTSTELHEFNFFRQYFIRELGGSFFINKIKGFNPELSKQAVTLEVIKISDQTPDSTFITETAFEDGVSNFFTDALGNYYI